MIQGLNEQTDLNAISKMVKEKRQQLTSGMKYSLQVDGTIDVKGLGVGKIIKVNRTRCLAKFDKGRYNVPFSLIKEVFDE
jgi:hypothetical protein